MDRDGDSGDENTKRNPSQIRSSFEDVVIYNDQGQPTIDLNRLVYKPNESKREKQKEKLAWYFPDYSFIVVNILSLTYATYFVLNGVQLIGWKNTMQWFVIKDCEKASETNSKEVCATIQSQYGDDDMSPYTIVRFYGFSDPSKHGMALLILGLIGILNIVNGIHSTIKGSRALLNFHVVLDVALFLFEVAWVVLLQITGRCDERDIEIIAAFLQRLVNNYRINDPSNHIKSDTEQLDRIQVSLTCCGVGNWTDFLPRSLWNENGTISKETHIERYNIDQSDMVIPSSCCRQWWVRNLYCGYEAHLWAYPTATEFQAHQLRQRISQWGCLPRMVNLCRQMVMMAGMGGIFAVCIHFILLIVKILSASIQIIRINTLVREQRRIFNHKEHVHEMKKGANEEDFFPGAASLLALYQFQSSEMTMAPAMSLPRPPLEKEMVNLKSRETTNNLIASVKDTHVQDWIDSGKAFVEGKENGPEEQEEKLVERIWRNRSSKLVKESNLNTISQKQTSGGVVSRIDSEEREEDINALEAIKLLQNIKSE